MRDFADIFSGDMQAQQSITCKQSTPKAREPAASTQHDGRGHSPEHLPQRYAQNGASNTAATRVPIVI